MGKSIPNILTGVMMSIFSYAAILFLGIVVGLNLNINAHYRYVLNVGIDFLAYSLLFGALGGYIGGDTNGSNGAIMGGIIGGIVAAVIRLIFIFVT